MSERQAGPKDCGLQASARSLNNGEDRSDHRSEGDIRVDVRHPTDGEGEHFLELN